MSRTFTPTAGARVQFASDNCAGICPEALAAIEKANAGNELAYGNDQWTTRASDLLRELFEIDCQVFFCFNGTAANSMTVAHLCQSYHSVIAHDMSHIETDECGGPEFFSHGSKLLLATGPEGKLTPDAIRAIVDRRDDIHFPKPHLVSLTQSTEMGTVYDPAELDALRETARRLKLRVHMDGARFANAVAALDVAPKEITWKVGVDVLCFGGTKNGMPIGEAVVFFDKSLAHEFDYRCKQAGQLASKMRFLAAPWVGMLDSGAWLSNAQHANDMARRLARGLQDIPGVKLLHPTQANAVFVHLPPHLLEGVRDRGWFAYTFIADGGVRFMCSWQTRSEDIEALLADLKDLAAAAD